jgi:hypothetical protein
MPLTEPGVRLSVRTGLSTDLGEIGGLELPTSLIQLALHVQEPSPVGLRGHIHGLPPRSACRIDLLPSFAMYAVFPRSDYYEGSVPRPRHRSTWEFAGISLCPALGSEFPCSSEEPVVF